MSHATIFSAQPPPLETYKVKRRMFERLMIPLPVELQEKDTIDVAIGSWLDQEFRRAITAKGNEIQAII